MSLVCLVRGERQDVNLVTGMEGGIQKARKCDLWNGFLVDRDGKSTLCDMECSLCCALVICRVVQDALLDSVCRYIFAKE